ncbi:sulfur carrier protein ThiS [Aurantimonas sp. VKM B-3413]|uniref:sulfur carrier protein ThiS n=1 Tax=Aurantimonas sp. VKM B-3413 TaxID=2779401 RepID=UPI001E35D28F|nr:sulfur carrier protein ThiS [Aurantimonas sp. VKM B-3413]MCB8839524.1 sulfur carrier protein ThiS [Aurantimonas sp. VKM B-3413]
MKIIVNGERREAEAVTLAALLLDLGYEGAIVATAINGDFVPASDREAQPLGDGDRVEILAPMQGG